MFRLLIAMFHPRTPPGKHRDRDMLLTDRIRSGGIGDLPDGNGAAVLPASYGSSALREPEPGRILPAQILLPGREVGSDGG